MPGGKGVGAAAAWGGGWSGFYLAVHSARNGGDEMQPAALSMPDLVWSHSEPSAFAHQTYIGIYVYTYIYIYNILGTTHTHITPNVHSIVACLKVAYFKPS